MRERGEGRQQADKQTDRDRERKSDIQTDRHRKI